ncbi:alpha/beta fold hydrolase [Streptomyces sp. NPDC015127]|uniref:alpha/beta fold hydrolase n=1 Tax=Streptomyces sp. NPDC015127 TaxID=3364939 RepID=UPI0036FBFC8C
MAVMSSLIAAADRPGRAARAVAAHFRYPAERATEEPGRVLPQAVSFAEAHAAGLPPVTVAYERHGMGEPLVLLHGLGDSRQAWHSVLPLLVDGRDAIA